MLAIRKLNNNAVICRDSRGREVVALGKGVGFGGDFPRELAMDHIERTFYSIDAEGQRIMQDLPADVVLFTAKIMDIVENELPYELSPNAVLIMADHIAFAIARQRKGIRFDMPLTYDVQQLYPLEYKIGRYITARAAGVGRRAAARRGGKHRHEFGQCKDWGRGYCGKRSRPIV